MLEQLFTLLDLKRPLLTTKGCVDCSGIVGERLDDLDIGKFLMSERMA